MTHAITPTPAAAAEHNRPAEGLDLLGLFAAVDSARTIMAFDATDWSGHRAEAWLYGLFNGWNGDPDDPDDPGAWQDIARRHGWSADDLTRLRAMHTAVDALTLPAVTAHLGQQRPLAVAAVPDRLGEVRAELGRMDGKANTMIVRAAGGAGLGAAALWGAHLPLIAEILGWTAVGLALLALEVVALVIRPQLGGNHGFVAHANAEHADLLDTMRTADPDVEARRLAWLSNRVKDGFRKIRLATDLLMFAAVPVAVLAGLTAVILR